LGTKIILGDALEQLRLLPDESVHCCVTSPPYWGLRDYGVGGQLGLEATPEEYIAKMVEVFREVRRVLRSDGTLWLNIGDSYAGSWGAQGRQGATGEMAGRSVAAARERSIISAAQIAAHPQTTSNTGSIPAGSGLKPKDLVGIPWMLAFALRADGWYLRQDIIWHKPNPMPESVRDRCTKAHEYIFLLAKSERYYYDNEAIAENTESVCTRKRSSAFRQQDENAEQMLTTIGRNKRSVWTVTTQPFKEAHFATFPPALIEPCIKAGCPVDGTVLDPFGGAGTTGLVSDRLQRNAILIELNPAYATIAKNRITDDGPLFAVVA
jgi:DNA modification methylase